MHRLHVYRMIKMEILGWASNLFWEDRFWLPPNVTWKILEESRREDMFIPKPVHMLIPIPMAVCLFCCRLLWERFVAQPIGKYYKVKEKPPRAPEPIDILEKAYKKSRTIPSEDIVLGLAKQLDWEPRKVERWWRLRRVKGKPSELQRFKETSWRFIFYLLAFYYGLYILWDKKYFWETKFCWIGYPQQHVTSAVWWYYMVELAFYYSLIISIFMDNKRKDFWEMMIHHAATIGLMVFSWSVNFVRVGSLVLVVHDAVDYWLEGAKLSKYMQYHKFCDFCFVVFTVMWFVTRLVVYPIRVLNTTWFEYADNLEICPSYYIFNGLLLILQVLHIIWFYMIAKMAYGYIVKGQIDKDDRSESDPSDSEEEIPNLKKNGLVTPRTTLGEGDNIIAHNLQNGNAKKRLK